MTEIKRYKSPIRIRIRTSQLISKRSILRFICYFCMCNNATKSIRSPPNDMYNILLLLLLFIFIIAMKKKIYL